MLFSFYTTKPSIKWKTCKVYEKHGICKINFTDESEWWVLKKMDRWGQELRRMDLGKPPSFWSHISKSNTLVISFQMNAFTSSKWLFLKIPKFIKWIMPNPLQFFCVEGRLIKWMFFSGFQHCVKKVVAYKMFWDIPT